MRTMKLKILGVLTTMLLGATTTFGQTFYYSVDAGGVVIDCTMMPEGTVLTQSMANNEDGGDYQLPSHDEKDPENTVYPLLVVAMEDLKISSEVSKFPCISDDASEDTAVSLAKDYIKGGLSDWRLPNQRELMMIWVLHEEIEKYMEDKTDKFDSFQSNGYWSSTVYSSNSNSRWFVSFVNGVAHTNNASSDDKYARAVREIELPQAD